MDIGCVPYMYFWVLVRCSLVYVIHGCRSPRDDRTVLVLLEPRTVTHLGNRDLTSNR